MNVSVYAAECLDPTAGLAITGAVTDFNVPPSSACRGPAYNSSLGPIIDYRALAKKAAAKTPTDTETPSQTSPNGPALGSGEGADLYDLEAGTGGMVVDFNDRELERIGELDAMQGKPLDFNHADNLGYLKGYTRGNALRAQGAGRP